MSRNKKRGARGFQDQGDSNAPTITIPVHDHFELHLPEVSVSGLTSVALRGRTDLRLNCVPSGSTLEARPDGVDIPPEAALRCVLPPATPLKAAALQVEIAFTQAPFSSDGTLLSFVDGNGRSILLRDRGTRLILQVGQARLEFGRCTGKKQVIRFAVSASGLLVACGPDGFVEEVPGAFAPMEGFEFRQINVASKASILLHGLQVFVLDGDDPARLRDRVAASDQAQPDPAQPLLIHFNGQSLALGATVPAEQRFQLSEICRATVRMLTGVYLDDARRPMSVHGLQARDGIVDKSEASFGRARIVTYLPPALAMAQALAGHGNQGPDRLHPIVVAGNPVAGLSLELIEKSDGLARRNMDAVMEATQLAFRETAEMPGHVAYFWIQGEADRQAARGAYLRGLTDHWDRIRTTLDRLYPQAGKTMLLLQTAGSDQTHQPREPYHPAADQLDFVAGRPDAVMVGPAYPSRLIDRIHPDLHHSRLMGELAAWALRETLAGRPWSIGRPLTRRDGDLISLRFPLRPDESLTAHDADPYGGVGIDKFLGLEVEGGGALHEIRMQGHDLLMTVTGQISAVRYAMQRQSMRIDGNVYPARRGLIRTTLARPAVHVPQGMLYRWLPSFTVDL